MSGQLPTYITEHPLYKATKRCINHSVDVYDYRKFYPSWNSNGILTSRDIIKEIFDITEDKVDEYIDLSIPQSLSIVLYHSLLPFDTEFAKDIAFFLFSLPISQNNLHSYMKSTPRSWADNRYSQNLRDFKFEDESMLVFEDSEILDFFNQVVNNSSNIDTMKGLFKLLFTFANTTDIYSNNAEEPTYTELYFREVVDPLCHFLSKISGSKVYSCASVKGSNYSDGSNNIVQLDIYVGIESKNQQRENIMEICCAIEVKPFPMIPIYEGPPMEGSGFFIMEKIPNFMRQMVVQMTYFKTNYGLLTDVYTTTILLIDLDKFEEKKEELYRRGGDKVIHLRYKIVNNFSHSPSARITLFYHLAKSVVSIDELKERQRRMVEFKKYLEKGPNDTLQQDSPRNFRKRRRSGTPSSDLSGSESSDNSSLRTSPPSSRGVVDIPETINEGEEPIDALIWDGPNSVIQSGIYDSQIFKIDAKKFKEFLSIEGQGDTKLIAKVYDPSMCRKIISRERTDEDYYYIRDLYIRSFILERRILQELYRDKNFNSCYIPHKTAIISIIIDGMVVAVGYFNLLQYIKCKPLPQNEETHEKAKRQLEIIHNHGIIHGDIAERNILYSEDGKVYIIDFQHSIRENKAEHSLFSKEKDIVDLDRIFLSKASCK